MTIKTCPECSQWYLDDTDKCGKCEHAELTAENARLRKQVEELAGEEAACGTIAGLYDLFAEEISKETGVSINDMARRMYEQGQIKQRLDAIVGRGGAERMRDATEMDVIDYDSQEFTRDGTSYRLNGVRGEPGSKSMTVHADEVLEFEVYLPFAEIRDGVRHEYLLHPAANER